jgi:glycosyltransferase involved in cell wall biosynthesis
VQNAYKVDFWDVDEMTRIVNHLISNPDECKRVGEEGRDEVNRIGWDEVAETLKGYYEELV